MGLSQAIVEFLQPIGVGVAVVLVLLGIVGVKLPRRTAILARRRVK
jgi:hypothetical protein